MFPVAMTTALITHPDCLGHVTPEGHPEQVARLSSVLAALEPLDLPQTLAPLATIEDLVLCHPASYLAELRSVAPQAGQHQLDEDTFMSPGSMSAALRAAGGVVRAVDMVLGGEAANAFVATRPPGHHAEQSRPMGFCLFGNVSIGAKHALERHDLSRVAIVDFDVHHGNGTQALCQEDERILVVTSQQMPLWPGTGDPLDSGPFGSVMNVAFPPETGSDLFRETYSQDIFPRIDAFEPDLILISAGFDAHADDPLAQMNLATSDFAWVTHGLCDLADKHCGGRVVSALEGGYNLSALAASAAAHVQVLKERGR